jgi:hypothetical protein
VDPMKATRLLARVSVHRHVSLLGKWGCFAALASCGSPPETAAPVPIVLATASTQSAKPLAPISASTAQPPGLLGLIRFEHPQQSLATLAHWQGMPDFPVKNILVDASDLSIPESAIDLKRAFILALHHNGTGSRDVGLIALTSATEVLAKYPHALEVAPGVLEVQSRERKAQDVEESARVTDKARSTAGSLPDPATDPEARVCWLGTLKAGDAMVCGQRASVSLPNR